MQSKIGFMFTLRLCFIGVILTVGALSYLEHQDEFYDFISVVSSDLQQVFIESVVTMIGACGIILIAVFFLRLILINSDPTILDSIEPGQYQIISLSPYAYRSCDRRAGLEMVLATLEKVDKRGRHGQPTLYNLPLELFSDKQLEITYQNNQALFVESKNGFTFCVFGHAYQLKSYKFKESDSKSVLDDFNRNEGFFTSIWLSIKSVLFSEYPTVPRGIPQSKPDSEDDNKDIKSDIPL